MLEPNEIERYIVNELFNSSIYAISMILVYTRTLGS
jgi:hypothetical protein